MPFGGGGAVERPPKHSREEVGRLDGRSAPSDHCRHAVLPPAAALPGDVDMGTASAAAAGAGAGVWIWIWGPILRLTGRARGQGQGHGARAGAKGTRPKPFVW